MPRVKGQTDDIHVKIQRGLRDASIDHMAIEDPRCWPWQGALTKSGSARLGKEVVHHLLFELHIRTISGEEDYKLPATEYEGTVYHELHPIGVTSKQPYATPQVYSHPRCGHNSCINPYHRDWLGVISPKPNDWNPKTDKPEELRQSVPSLPATPVVSTLTADITRWLREGPADLSFDELFAEAQMDFYEHPVEDIRAALTEVLKS